jgi:GNAT superfamily N-acetyltransferase
MNRQIYDRPIHGCIHDMFITGKHRRKGIGENMLVEIMKWFKSRDILRIELDVLAQNQVAASFWGKQGFTSSYWVMGCHNLLSG